MTYKIEKITTSDSTNISSGHIDITGTSFAPSNSTYTFGGNTTDNITWDYAPSTSTVNIISGSTIYNVFDLPKKKMPIKVYVCGRIMTMGLLGTNVECAYTGGQLVFEPGIFAFLVAGRNTLSVEYRDEIYHYNVVDFGEKKLKVELVSIVNLGDE